MSPKRTFNVWTAVIKQICCLCFLPEVEKEGNRCKLPLQLIWEIPFGFKQQWHQSFSQVAWIKIKIRKLCSELFSKGKPMTKCGLKLSFEDASNFPVHEIAFSPYFILYIFVPRYGSTFWFSKTFLCKIKKCTMTFCQSNTDTEEPDVKRIIVWHI